MQHIYNYVVIAILSTFSIVTVSYAFGIEMPDCKVVQELQRLTLFPNDTEFVVYTNITHSNGNDYHGMLRIGIPGDLGYKCQFDGTAKTIIEYAFKQGEIHLGREYYICINNLDNDRENCDTHRYTVWENPEVANILSK
ncbi:MAG TPA: hypothetical protein VH415_08140 [Nitrososphaeraceae archaeon]